MALVPHRTGDPRNELNKDPKYFVRDPMFNFIAAQAIDKIGDPGLVAEVVRF